MGDITYAVVDMETTGLDAELDVPLEVGIKLIDAVGYVLAEESWFVWENGDDFQRAVSRGRDNRYVDEMHTKSGLWKDLEKIDHAELPHTHRERVDELMCDFLMEHEVRWGTLGMMGNSIGSLDRPFTIRHFPGLNEALGYRNIDMSSFREVMKRTNPVLLENLKPILGSKEDASHRVLDDIDACITEYRAYLQEFLIVDVEVS